MNKDEIRDIIFYKKNNNEILTEEETDTALKYFSEEEINCMVMPVFNHESCFSKKITCSIPEEKIQSYRLQNK